MPRLEDLSDRDILDQVLAARRESFEARRVKDSWARKAWNWYNNVHDWSQKEDWQTQVALPKFAMAVDQATQLMRQGMDRAQRLFGIEVLNQDPIDRLLAAFFVAVINEIIRQIKLSRVLVDGLKVALITNQAVHKVGFEVDQRIEIAPGFREVDETKDGITQKRPEFFEEEVVNTIALPTVTLVDPLRYYPDPRRLGLYEVQDVWMDKYKALDKFRGIADAETLADYEDDEGSWFDADTDQQVDDRNRAEQLEVENAWRRPTKLTEYWGAWFTRDGKFITKRARAIIADDKYVLLRPDQYPYWDGETPYTKYQGISVPFSAWGKLLVQHVDGIQFNANELISLMVDKAKMSALGETAVDVTLLDDLEDIVTGLFPGKMWKTKGQGAIEGVRREGVTTDNFQLQGLLGNEMTNAHAMSEFLSGQATTRGRATATEVDVKAEQGMGFFGGIIAEASGGAETIFEKLYSRVMQFKDDWSDPAIQKIAMRFGLEKILPKLNPVERYRLMKRPFRFHASGLNAAIKRAEMLKNLTDMMTVLGNFGPEAFQNLPMDRIFSKILEAFDMDELLNTPSTQQQVVVPGPLDSVAPSSVGGNVSPEQFMAGVQQRISGQPTGGGAQ